MTAGSHIKLKRKGMCKTCIYRHKVAIDNKDVLGKHECHELQEANIGCAGSIIKRKLIDIKTPKHLEEKWTSNRVNWKEIIGTTVRNRRAA